MTVYELLVQSANRCPDAEALVFEGTRWTYRELAHRVDRLASGLLGLGLIRGDRVGVHLLNCSHAYETILACARSGLVFVPLNHMLNGRELATVIGHAGIRAVVGEASLSAMLTEALDSVDVEHVVSIDTLASIDTVVSTDTVVGIDTFGGVTYAYEELVESSAKLPEIPIAEDDLFALMYTSGTTGLPKGVTLTHKNVATHAQNMVRDYGYDGDSVGLVALPYFVGASLNGVGLPCLMQGGRIVIQRTFSPGPFLDLVESESITHVQTVPTLLIRVLDSGLMTPGRIPTLRVLGYGSAPMPISRLREAITTFGPILYQMYGPTETCAMAACLRPEDHVLDGELSDRLSSCGRTVEGVEVRIVDEFGVDVASGEIGEVVIRGETVTDGYWDMPDLTAEAVPDGWFRSGDLATQDADGYVYLAGRKKDVIISGGFNIYPKEVEEAFFAHPDVADCAVIGSPDPEWGEAVSAFVCLSRNASVDESDLLAYGRAQLSSFKRPKSVSVVEEIPRNPSGKVLKRVLRERTEIRMKS